MTHNANPVPENSGAGLVFDTGLDSRAFARSQFGRFIDEPGLIVRLGDGASGGGAATGSVKLWRASGVREVTDAGSGGGRSTMVIWGPPVEGDRLDLLLNNTGQEKALAAISAWIQAIFTLKDNNPPRDPPLWPCAATVAQDGTTSQVFFAPPTLVQRCIMGIDKPPQFSGGEWYVHPDLRGINAAAFTAAAMLYRVFTGMPPFPAQDESLLPQDIREGNFLPIRFAVPGINGRLAFLIHYALSPTDKKNNNAVSELSGGGGIIKGDALLSEMLEILQKGEPFIRPLAEADQLLLEKEKKQFVKTNAAEVKVRRFVARNKVSLLAGVGVFIALILIIASIAQSRARMPTTAGMDPVQVIESYYNAFGDMNHQLMEACVTGGAGKNDIGMVVNFFAVTKLRQSTEYRTAPVVVSARDWQEGKTELSAVTQVFGVTDLSIEAVQFLPGGGSGDTPLDGDKIIYQITYILWLPSPGGDELSPELLPSPEPNPRSDLVTLVRKKGNWRIAEIIRAIR